MGKRLDAFKETLSAAIRNHIHDAGYCYSGSACVIDDIHRSFDAIADAIHGMPGDPGPLYNTAERVWRVAYEAKRRAGR
jgi:hypothetical protein